jgi:GAF domain-containing protein
MPERDLQETDLLSLRLFARVQRVYGRLDDLPAMLDYLAETILHMLEEVDPRHARAAHLLGSAGLLSRAPGHGVFRPLRLKGRPDPAELRSFVEHVGPGDLEHPTGLMGWAAARRKVALRRGEEWLVAERDDGLDRWGALRPATPAETGEMERASISAYPSLRAQLAVPVLDPEMRGEARPRHTIGIVNVESDELLTDRFCQFMIAFTHSVGQPLTAALRLRDLDRLARRLALPLTRGTLAHALLDATLHYLPGTARRGLVAIRDFHHEDRFVVEARAGDGPGDAGDRAAPREASVLATADGLCGQAILTRRVQYVPDFPRRAHAVHRPLWSDSHCTLAIPLVSGDGSTCLGLLVLESGETSYAFSTQDQSFLRTAAGLAAVAIAAIREPRLEHPEAVDVPALLLRLRHARLEDLPDDQIVRVNAICRALIQHRFVFPRAAEAARLTVHILREYTSRTPRIVDVDALRMIAARQREQARAASGGAAGAPDGGDVQEAA